jgi:aldose 1-epimerase
MRDDLIEGAMSGDHCRCEPFGVLQTREEVELYTLANAAGIVVEILTYGGIVRRVLAPDRKGGSANIVLGLATLDEYATDNSAYLGALIGRYANRLAGATSAPAGRRSRAPAHDGRNSLHGGTEGFDRRVWRASAPPASSERCGLTLAYTSAAGEMGYPGTLSVVVTYTLSAEGTLRIDYEAETDAPTIVNLTNHTYWNLAGEGSRSVDDHVLQVAATAYTPYDAALIPTGAIEPVAATPFDFGEPTPLGARSKDGVGHSAGYDVNYVIDRRHPAELEFAAELHDPVSGRTLSVWTTEPGLQLYDGHLLDGTRTGTGGRPLGPRSGVALETQHFPDSPNRPAFPSTVLRPGEVFRSATEYRLHVRG